MMILPIGTRIRSLRDPKITGTVQGYGTLFPASPILGSINNVTLVYLVWREGSLGSLGSNSLTDPTVFVLDVQQVYAERLDQTPQGDQPLRDVCMICVTNGCPSCHARGERCPCVRGGRT